MKPYRTIKLFCRGVEKGSFVLGLIEDEAGAKRADSIYSEMVRDLASRETWLTIEATDSLDSSKTSPIPPHRAMVGQMIEIFRGKLYEPTPPPARQSLLKRFLSWLEERGEEAMKNPSSQIWM